MIRLEKLMFVAILLLLCVTAFCGPVARVNNNSVDMGEVYSGDKIFSSFELFNDGNEPLEIFAIDTNCRCVEFIYPKRDSGKIPGGALIPKTNVPKTVAPNSSVIIPFMFSQSNASSKILKIITISTNDPNHLNTVVTVTGFAKPIASVTPASHFAIGQAEGGTVHTGKIVVTPKDKQFKLGKVYYAHSNNVKVSYKKLNDGLGSYEVTLKVTLPEKRGNFFERIEIDTDLPNKPILLLMTSAVVK